MLNLIFFIENSEVSDFVNPNKADFEEAYADNSLKPTFPTIDPIFTMEQCSLFLDLLILNIL